MIFTVSSRWAVQLASKHETKQPSTVQTPLKLGLSVSEKDSSEAVTSFVHYVHQLMVLTQMIYCTFIVFRAI